LQAAVFSDAKAGMAGDSGRGLPHSTSWRDNRTGGRYPEGREAERRPTFFTNHLTNGGSNVRVLTGLGKGAGERAGAAGAVAGVIWPPSVRDGGRGFFDIAE